MPTGATMATAGGTAQNGNGQQRAVVPMVPFIRASAEHREPTGIDVQRALSNAGAQNLGNFDVPAYGYVRSLVVVVTATGGTTGVLAEDGPWNVLRDIALTEPNGAVIAQFNSGFEMYLANKYGGYRNALGADPKASPAYSTDGSGNFSFVLRVPIEINARDGLGSLPNQNAAATFKLRMNLASSAPSADGLVSTGYTVQPTVRVVAFLEAWDQPETSMAGAANQVTPPAMNTTQFWSSQIYNVNAGENTIRLTRVGNYIRNLIFIHRRAASTRANGQTDFPDPARLYLDTRPVDMVSKLLWLNTMYERTGYGARGIATNAAGGLDSGVFVYDFTHEFNGTLGMENRDLWLPTLGSTRLELQGSFAQAGTLTVLTNDVAIAGNVFI